MPDIGSMTQGVDPALVDQVIADIKTKLCTEAANALEDNGSIVSSLQEAWVGEDCEKFIDNFNNAIKAAKDALEGYQAQIETTLNEIPNQWKEFQSRNVS